jgi:hypothetical protein
MIQEESLQSKIEVLDWDFTAADTQYLTHAIHRYSGKFIPQIARQSIELLTKQGELVLDPYCGSGTTLLECSLAGRRSIGIDLNPLAALISRVKTRPIKQLALLEFVRRIKEDIGDLKSDSLNKQLSFLDLVGQQKRSRLDRAREDSRWTADWYVKWFQNDVRLELIAIHQRILEESCEDLRNVALVAFSDILRKSSNAHGSYPNVMFDKNRGAPPPATPRFIQRLDEIVAAVSQLEGALMGKPIPEVVRGNARLLPLEMESIDAVITHPPYIGSIPYAEYGILSLTWLGHNAKQLDKNLTGGRRQSKDVVEQFSIGYSDMIRESHRVLKPERFMLVLVGNPMVKARRVELAEMSRELAIAIGFKVAATHHRNGINRRANLMGHETLLVFQKL